MCIFAGIAAPVRVSSLQIQYVDSVIVHDFEKGWEDIAHIGNEIISASDATLIKAGIVFGTSLSLMPYDEEMRRAAQRNVNAIDGTPISIANEYGNILYPALGTIATYGIGLATSDESLRTFSRKTFTSLLVAGGITTVMKSVIGKSRPFMNEGSASYNPFSIDDARLSFPSGHSTVAFVMSASLSKIIDRWWADIVLYGLATGTAYARLHNDRHWLSDTVLGGAIGYYAVQWVFDADSRESEGEKENMTFLPIIQPNSLGMMIVF
jgi:hypothetical protein